MNGRCAALLALVAAFLTAFAPHLFSAPEKDDKPKKTGVLVLGTSSYWRCFYALKPPVLRKGAGLETIHMTSRNTVQGKWLETETPPPPGGWRTVDFDDVGWHRMPATDPDSPWVALLAMRGKFAVTDPAKVREMKLTVHYRGGIVVTLNGKEIARGHLKPNAGPDDLAEDYAEGKLKEPRAIEDLVVPSSALRRGVNVLAFELHRSAYRESAVQMNRDNLTVDGGTCGPLEVRLTASSAEGLVPNVTRPAGLQVWNSDLLASDFIVDHGDPNETLKPVRIVAPIGGAGSGKVVVGSDKPIKGLQAKMTVLRHVRGRSTIPFDAVDVRCAFPGGGEQGANEVFTVNPARFDGLDDVPPDEVPVRTATQSWRGRTLPEEPPITFGAVAPVWVTVNVPRDAAAGDYTGQLTVTVPDEKPVVASIRLRVSPWKVPDPVDYVTFVELVQSPETLAMRYDVPSWSPKHWELIDRSLTLLGQVGNRTCHVPLICDTNQGNDETMVRWIRQDDGSYTHDFTVMDKYLDLVVARQGKPTVVCFYVWDTYLDGGRGGAEQWASQAVKDDRKAHEDVGPLVSLLDPVTGKVEKHALPKYRDERSVALWKPLFDELRERMKKRGLEKAMTVGIMTDNVPTKEVVECWKKVAPGVPWVSHAHPYRTEQYDVPVAYASGVWSGGKFADDPSEGRTYGWQRKHVGTHHPRSMNDAFAQTTWRFLGEMNVTGQQRGFSRIGADFFAVLKDSRGRYRGDLSARFPKTSWRNLDIRTTVLAPGKNGPVATARFEMIREGLQECEARVFIEKALLDKTLRTKLGENFATTCQTLLDDRVRDMRKALSTLQAFGGSWTSYAYIDNSWWQASPLVGSRWFISSDWQGKTEALYEAAAEVEKKLAP